MGIKSIVNLYIILWLAVEKPSFSLNIKQETRPGCKNQQISLIMVNLSEILLGGMQQKYGLSELKYGLMSWFKNVGFSRTSSIELVVVKLLLVKCSQAFSNWIKKTSLFCFCKSLSLLDLRICFNLTRVDLD